MNDNIILGYEAELREAMMTNDVAALDRLIDDTLMFTTLEGAVVGKEDDLAAHRARRLRLERMEPGELRIQHHGDIVVVSVRMDMRGTWDGERADGALRYTRIWAKRAEGWRIVAGHMSAVQETAS